MTKRRDPHARVILFLGAGASCFAEYCTFVTFPSLLFDHDLRKREGMPGLPDNSERILIEIKNSLERNSIATTHDNFLWRLDAYLNFLNLNLSDDVLQSVLRENTKLYDLNQRTRQAIDQITATTVRHYSANRANVVQGSNFNGCQGMHHVLDLYCGMARLNGATPFLPVFTTNYDMLLEDLVAGVDVKDRPVFVNGIRDVTSELATWTSREYDRAKGGIHLYRLHGCACWFYHAEGDSGVYFHRRDAAHQRLDGLCAMYPGHEAERGAGPHGFGFRKFYAALQTCELVVFIGFSFRDDDVKHVLLNALAGRRGKPRILMVDQLYGALDLQSRLEEASRTSPLPCRVPGKREIRSIKLRFGESAEDDMQVLDTCQSMLKGS